MTGVLLPNTFVLLVSSLSLLGEVAQTVERAAHNR